MNNSEERCHCGQKLHYRSEASELFVRKLIAMYGDFVDVTVEGSTWRVQRHYIALHGLKADELPTIGFERVK